MALCLMLTATWPAAAAPPAASGSGDDPASKTVAEQLKLILDKLETEKNFFAARKSTKDLFNRVVAHAPAGSTAAFRDAAFAVRLIQQLEDVPDRQRTELIKFLRAHPNLAYTTAFLIKPQDKPALVYRLIGRLHEKYAAHIETYANLAAALAVVHDKPLIHRINENSTTADNPVDLFAFYLANEKRMYFGIKKVPAQLLVYVVDSGVELRQMNWALEKYAGRRKVGNLFFDIDYDHDHLRKGTTKKVTEAGWSLPNILEHGGVSADQAYFAVAVGKSIGVPTAYTTGRAGELSHAWVGFLEPRGRRGVWNFDVGRYPEYQGVKGNLTDPQTRKTIPDSFLAIQGILIGTTAVERQNAAALTDAANHLLERATLFEDTRPEPLIANATTSPRTPELRHITELLEAALQQSAGHLPAWLVVQELAAEDKLSLTEKKTWYRRIKTLCGSQYPDFTLAMIKPMISTVKDTNEQNAMWDSAFGMFTRRADLAAEARIAQGQMWLEAGDTKKARKCYEDVVQRFLNSGPFALEALDRIEDLLNEGTEKGKILMIYERTWKSIKKPDRSPFMTQSNWYRIGHAYRTKLHAFIGQYDENDPRLEPFRREFSRVDHELDTVAGL